MTSRVLCILIKSVALRTTLVKHFTRPSKSFRVLVLKAFYQTLFPRSGDVIHPQLRESGSGYETRGGGGGGGGSGYGQRLVTHSTLP